MIYEIFKASLEFLADVQGAFKLLLRFFNTTRYILGENQYRETLRTLRTHLTFIYSGFTKQQECYYSEGKCESSAFGPAAPGLRGRTAHPVSVSDRV